MLLCSANHPSPTSIRCVPYDFYGLKSADLPPFRQGHTETHVHTRIAVALGCEAAQRTSIVYFTKIISLQWRAPAIGM